MPFCTHDNMYAIFGIQCIQLQINLGLSWLGIAKILKISALGGRSVGDRHWDLLWQEGRERPLVGTAKSEHPTSSSLPPSRTWKMSKSPAYFFTVSCTLLTKQDVQWHTRRNNSSDIHFEWKKKNPRCDTGSPSCWRCNPHPPTVWTNCIELQLELCRVAPAAGRYNRNPMQQISQNCTKCCKQNQRSKLELSKTSPDEVPLSVSLKHLLSSSPSNTKDFEQRTHMLGKGCNKLHRSAKLWISWHAQRGLTVTPLRLAFCLCKFTPQLIPWF